MLHRHVILFLVLAIMFVLTHQFAVVASLYWYYWWFDIVMHFWGGALLGLGLHALCTFRKVTIQPTWTLLLIILAVVTTTWEVLEWAVGITSSENYLMDISKDILFGFGGGLLAHMVLKTDTIKRI